MKNAKNELYDAWAVPAQLRVAVVGSRSLRHCPELLARLDELHDAGLLGAVVSGGACGVDQAAAYWARCHRVALAEWLPDYRAHGKAAPLVRNPAIVDGADVVLVCWDGVSRGTLNTARHAARLGVRCEWLVAPAPGSRAVPGGLGL